MEQINIKAKKWGNSLGIILPKFIVDKEKISEGTDLVLNIKAKNKTTIKDLMELGRRLNLTNKLQKINTQEAFKEIDKAFWPE